MTLNQITSESAALWVDNPTNNSPSICFDYIFALLAEIGSPEIFPRKIAGSNFSLHPNQPPRTSSFEPTEKATAVVSYDPTDRKKHDPQVLTQNISNESQSNTSKWDMGNAWTIVSTAPATCEGNSFWFHARCCAIIVRSGNLKIKWVKTFPEILDMSQIGHLFSSKNRRKNWIWWKTKTYSSNLLRA